MSSERYSPLHRPQSSSLIERKIHKFPLSLFFSTFKRQTSESSTKLDTNDAKIKRKLFRSTHSIETPMIEKNPYKKSYRTLLTPDDCENETSFFNNSQSDKSDDNNHLKLIHSPLKRLKVSKSVSFQDLVIYPTVLTNAFRSISPGRSTRSSLSSEFNNFSITSTINQKNGIKKSLSNYLLGFQEEKAMQAVPVAPVDASKFVAYVAARRKKRILFRGEYLMVLKSIDQYKCQCNVATSMPDKNQYSDTLPYDHSRVILSIKNHDENSHYINASYVDSFLNEKAYVVTQSVKSKQACGEFWRMIWELKTNTIVMLTKVFDFMRVMCVQYWPTTTFRFGEIEVETLETKTYAHFIIRTIKLNNVNDPTNEERIIKHFHFTEWELNSFPYISAFIELRRRVRQWTDKNPTNAPIVVHCSNGAGRSGAFLALDANLELLNKTNQLDVYEYTKKMVNARPNLIDSVEQYMFIYDVLSEAVLCNIRPIELYELKERSSMYRSKKDREKMEHQDSHENKLLMTLTSTLKIGDCAGGHRMENRSKNRDVMVVPPDHARPYLQTLHGESKDYTYINAVEVDGFTRKSEYIVTEWPKQSTVDSFWTLIFDHSAHTVINLTNSQNNSKVYPQFVHTKGKQNYGPFVVEVLNHQQYPAMSSTMVKIQKRTFMISEIMATGATQQQVEAEIRICCIIQAKMWPLENKVPLSTSGLIELIKMGRSWRRRAPDRPETKPTIVMSHNGYSRCGIFIGANVCIDQMDMDHEVDVFHVVKMIRINRPQLIDMKDEYKYLYDLMLHWYMTNPEYRLYEEQRLKDQDDNENDKICNGNLVTKSSIKSNSSRKSIQQQPVFLN